MWNKHKVYLYCRLLLTILPREKKSDGFAILRVNKANGTVFNLLRVLL